VPEKPRRRSFSRPYRLKIVQQADACSQHGELGQLLRREGLYSSHLAAWRQQRDAGLLQSAGATRRGRKKSAANPLTAENERLRRENQRLTTRLQQAETILDVQKKVCALLGLIPNATPSTENDS
jgi:transposase-like protein